MSELQEQTARALIERIDAMTLWLQRISEQLEQQGRQESASIVVQAGQTQRLTDLLVSYCIQSSPELTREETINAVTPTLLYRNDSIKFQWIRVTNDDPAQWIYVGKRYVSVNNGEIIQAQEHQDYVLPQGDELWAICVVATVSVRISEGFDLVGMTQQIQSAAG